MESVCKVLLHYVWIKKRSTFVSLVYWHLGVFKVLPASMLITSNLVWTVEWRQEACEDGVKWWQESPARSGADSCDQQQAAARRWGTRHEAREASNSSIVFTHRVSGCCHLYCTHTWGCQMSHVQLFATPWSRALFSSLMKSLLMMDFFLIATLLSTYGCLQGYAYLYKQEAMLSDYLSNLSLFL
jgi:hypothetical protein